MTHTLFVWLVWLAPRALVVFLIGCFLLSRLWRRDENIGIEREKKQRHARDRAQAMQASQHDAPLLQLARGEYTKSPD